MEFLAFLDIEVMPGVPSRRQGLPDSSVGCPGARLGVWVLQACPGAALVCGTAVGTGGSWTGAVERCSWVLYLLNLLGRL